MVSDVTVIRIRHILFSVFHIANKFLIFLKKFGRMRSFTSLLHNVGDMLHSDVKET